MKDKKIDSGTKHLLNLIRKEADDEGWSEVSRAVFPMIAGIPKELVELKRVGDDGRGRAKLTDLGANILDAMEWI